MNLSGGDGFSLPASMGGFPQLQQDRSHAPNPKPNPNPKKRRNQPGTPDPDAEVMALSPKTLMATNRFVCEICNKGFQRDQNLQLHRRGHNLPWKLRQRSSKEQARKKVYICPEETCVHHHPSRALGDLTGIKKHFSRKHGEKKWKCDKCSKKYAVQSDWKAHSKTCGTREYKCDCGTLFSRKDTFITHRAFCDALAEDTAARASPPPATLTFKTDAVPTNSINPQLPHGFATLQAFQDPNSLMFNPIFPNHFSSADTAAQMATGNVFNSNFGMMSNNQQLQHHSLGGLKEESSIHSVNTKKLETLGGTFYTSTTTDNNQSSNSPPAPMSATALLQRAAQMGSTRSSSASSLFANSFGAMNTSSGFHPISSSNHSNHHGNINPYQQQQQVMMQPMASNQNESSFSAALMSSSSAAMHMGNQLDQLMSTGARSCPTRDFLGVGSGYPFSPLELAGFAHFANTKGL